MSEIVKNITEKCIIPKMCRERFLPLKPDEADGMPNALLESGVYFAGVSELVQGYRIGRLNAGFHLVLFGVGGQGGFRTRNKRGFVEPGDIWVCPAGEPHEYWADGPWKILFFHIHRESHCFGNALDRAQWGHSRSAGQLENAMVWLINEYQFELSHSRDLYRHYASIIRLSLDRELSGLAIPMQTRTHKLLDGLWQEVNESLAMPWSLQSLAQRMHVSTAQLRRIVQAHHEVAPMEMVQRLRIRKAQQLLRTTKDSLDQIAERVGYNSPFSFSRAFKKATGISPKSYREKVLDYN